jgi:TonB-dependent SusC/RagA subfamily outer membrane receptor
VLRKLKDEDIESVKLLSGEQAIELYGQKASNGVVFIETRRK